MNLPTKAPPHQRLPLMDDLSVKCLLCETTVHLKTSPSRPPRSSGGCPPPAVPSPHVQAKHQQDRYRLHINERLRALFSWRTAAVTSLIIQIPQSVIVIFLDCFFFQLKKQGGHVQDGVLFASYSCYKNRFLLIQLGLEWISKRKC